MSPECLLCNASSIEVGECTAVWVWIAACEVDETKVSVCSHCDFELGMAWSGTPLMSGFHSSLYAAGRSCVCPLWSESSSAEDKI